MMYTGPLQEVSENIQDLLTWPSADISFEEAVRPPMEQFPLALCITSLIPSLLASASSSTMLIRNPKPFQEKPSIPIAAPLTSLPQMPNSWQHRIKKQLGPAIRLPQISQPSIRLLNATRAILPPAVDDLTIKLSTVDPNSNNAVISPPAVDDLTIKLSTPTRHRGYALRLEVLLIVVILLVAAFAHGINMFHYPYFEDDEGTYMSQAWAVVHEGRLSPYTYTYGHAPLGWIQIAAWTLVTGGFHTFGPAIYSGRILMLLMQVGSTFMLYCIARSISRNITVAVIASLLFALSPFGLYFYRLVLLDNITTFWMLLSILLLVLEHLSLKRVWLSAVALSISILSKELTIFLVPIMAYLVFFRANRSHRWFATIGWIALVGSLVSLYPLMAILNNELFPAGTLLGGTAPHVSLIGSLFYQASRGKDAGLFSLSSEFWMQTKAWMQGDPILVIAGSFCAILSVLMMKWQRLIGVMGAMTLSLWAFFARGGIVFNFYIVPLLPLLALNVSLLLGLVAKSLKTSIKTFTLTNSTVGRIFEQGVIILCFVGLVLGCLAFNTTVGSASPDPAIAYKNNPLILWNNMQADAQNQATQWVEKNLPLHSRIMIDEYLWTDLYDSGYTNAHYYWMVETDPTIRNGVFHNDWRNVDYIITTPQVLTDMQEAHLSLVRAALYHSTLLVYFDMGGWRVEIRKVNK